MFFAQFEGFVYNPDNPAHHEFHRLCLCRCWTWDSPELKFARDGFIAASTAEHVYRIGIFAMNARAAGVSQPLAAPASNIPRFIETEIADSTTGPSEWQDYVDYSQDLLYCSSLLPESNETTIKHDSLSPASGVVIHPAEPSPSNKNANKVTSPHNIRVPSNSTAKHSGTNKKTEKHKTQSNAGGISKEKKQTTINDPNPLSDFFDQYPGFKHYPKKSVSDEFRRLMEFINGKSGTTEKEKAEEKAEAKTKYKDALTMQFNIYFGRDVNNIGAWQALCTWLEIDPLPQTIYECKLILGRTHVNLVDLIDAQRFLKSNGRRRSIRKFETVEELSDYTKQTERYFPRHNVHAGSLLKLLLRQILYPSTDT